MASSAASQIQTQMMIRRPVAVVFEAFVDPAQTTRFWFTKSDGRLEAGKHFTWEWEMYGASAPVYVKALESHRIEIEWGTPATPVSFEFTEQGPDATLVTITHRGFEGAPEEVFAMAVDSMGGFSLVLAGSKAYLEHDIELNLVADRAPDAHVGAA